MSTSHPCQNNDHNQCVEKALQQAEQICQQRQVKLTPLRKRVFNLIWKNHKPLGAYDILNMLTVEDGRMAAPPTVYRALDFLLDNHLIHRLSSCNAYIGCHHLNQHHQGYFLICSYCQTVTELNQPVLDQTIQRAANSVNFQIQQQTLEITGVCNHCQVDHEKVPY